MLGRSDSDGVSVSIDTDGSSRKCS
jgi:hypothetical protein